MLCMFYFQNYLVPNVGKKFLGIALSDAINVLRVISHVTAMRYVLVIVTYTHAIGIFAIVSCCS